MTCAKQHVQATIITPDGRRFTGSNACETPVQVCPRETLGYASGAGYHLCRYICQQPGHAEVVAIQRADTDVTGATIYIEGHTAACRACSAACDAAGIANIIIGPPPA